MSKDWPKLFSLEGKVAVVAGGAGLLGREVVVGMAKAGATVIIGESDQKRGDALVNECSDMGLAVAFNPLDIVDVNSLDSFIGIAAKLHGGIDIWVNCAYPRTEDWGDRFEDIDVESWRKNIDMHLNGYFLASQRAAEHMKKRGGGCIINFSSIYGVRGPKFFIYEGSGMTMPAAYSAIKGGIINFTKYLATYYAPHNIRVNAICPGGVFDNQDPKFVEEYGKNTPMGRMAEPDEISGSAIFLASDAASYITGHILMVDGGWTVW